LGLFVHKCHTLGSTNFEKIHDDTGRQLALRSINQPINQSINQSVTQSINQSINGMRNKGIACSLVFRNRIKRNARFCKTSNCVNCVCVQLSPVL